MNKFDKNKCFTCHLEELDNLLTKDIKNKISELNNLNEELNNENI